MMTGNRIVGPEARKKILSEFQYDDSRIVRYPFKPFDVRWCYLENLRPLFSEPSPQLLDQRFPGNRFFVTRDTADKDPEGSPFYFSSLVCDYDCISGHARHFPLHLRPAPTRKSTQRTRQAGLFSDEVFTDAAPTANLPPAARAYLAALGIADPDADAETAGLLWMHALAIGYSPAYLAENVDGIRQDWPRVPPPADREALLASAELGRQVAALLDTERSVPGVTAGTIRPELRPIAPIARVGGGSLDPDAGDLAVTAGWGHGGRGGVTMPGRGRAVAREYTPEERAAIEAGVAVLGLSPDAAFAHLGAATHDIYLNGVAFWRNVPARVWGYTIGGYQVIKKWLSYRERDLLGRPLTGEEAREVAAMARRIAALLLLEPTLDANYAVAKAAAYAWPGAAVAAPDRA